VILGLSDISVAEVISFFGNCVGYQWIDDIKHIVPIADYDEQESGAASFRVLRSMKP
jgi:hypothetical protein